MGKRTRRKRRVQDENTTLSVPKNATQNFKTTMKQVNSDDQYNIRAHILTDDTEQSIRHINGTSFGNGCKEPVPPLVSPLDIEPMNVCDKNSSKSMSWKTLKSPIICSTRNDQDVTISHSELSEQQRTNQIAARSHFTAISCKLWKESTDHISNMNEDSHSNCRSVLLPEVIDDRKSIAGPSPNHGLNVTATSFEDSQRSFFRDTIRDSNRFSSPRMSAEMSSKLQCTPTSLRRELFLWNLPLPHTHFYEPVNHLLPILSNAIYYERFMWLGLLSCADAILYTLTFLPIKFALSLFAFMWNTLYGHTHHLQPRHYHALCQGISMLTTLLLLSYLQDYTHIFEPYETIADIKWTRLYVLFGLFALLDSILDRVGVRLNGALTYACNERSQMLTTLFALTVYVFLHSTILSLQISTVHTALDQNNELLSLLVSVKISDIKAGMSQQPVDALFKSSLGEVAVRFKSFTFIIIILLEKLLRLHTVDDALAAYNAADGPSFLQPMYDFIQWLWLIDWSALVGNIQFAAFSVFERPRLFLERILIFVVSPLPYVTHTAQFSAPSITPVRPSQTQYISLHSEWPQIVDDAATPSQKSLIGAVDSTSLWLPNYVMNAIVFIAMVVVIDLVKHSVLSIYGNIAQANYLTFRQRLSAAYVTAPKLGLEDSRFGFIQTHFDFLTLPIGTLLVRHIWQATLSWANSCQYGTLTARLWNANLVLSSSARDRCRRWFHVIQDEHTLGYWIDLPNASTLFWAAVIALLAVRLLLFLLAVLLKISLRLLLRIYSRQGYRIVQHNAVMYTHELKTDATVEEPMNKDKER